MSNLKILLKNNLNLLIGRIKGKKQKVSTVVAVILLSLAFIAILGLYGFQAYMMFVGLGQSLMLNGLEAYLDRLIMFHAFTTTLSVLVIIGIMRASANEKHSDNDFLLSLPIKKRDIVISKTVGKYLFDFAFVLILFAPFYVSYQFVINFNLQVLLLGILLTFLMPLLSIGITYIFDFLISRIFNKYKFAGLLKSLVPVLILIVILGLLLINTTSYGFITTFDGYFEKRPISNLFLNFLLNTNIINSVLTLSIIIIPFIVGFYLYAINFGKSFASYSSNSNKLIFTSNKTPFKIFLKKELNNYAQTTAFIVNTIIGAIGMFALGIYIAITGLEGLAQMFGPIQKQILVCVLILIYCFFNSTSLISACTISLEGKNLWILKSSPVNPTHLFLAKAFLQVVIVLPCLLISTVLIWIFLKLSLIEFLMVLTIPTIQIFILAFGGVYINLLFPNFDWEDPTVVVKQGLSVLLTMLLGFLLIGLLPILYFALQPLSFAIIYIIELFVNLAILALFMVLLFTNGKSLYKKL